MSTDRPGQETRSREASPGPGTGEGGSGDDHPERRSRRRWVIGLIVTSIVAIVAAVISFFGETWGELGQPKVSGVTCSSPTSAKRGEVIQVSYEIEATAALTVGLGAGIYDDGGRDYSTGHGDNDQLLVKAGRTPGEREVLIPSELRRGTYELTVEIWPPNKIGTGETLADQPCAQVTVT